MPTRSKKGYRRRSSKMTMPTLVDAAVVGNIAYQVLLDTSHGKQNIVHIGRAFRGEEGAINSLSQGLIDNATENAAKIIAPLLADMALKVAKKYLRLPSPRVGPIRVF